MTLTPTQISEPSNVTGLPERYQPWRLSHYGAEIVEKVTEWAKGPLWSLYLHGAAGTRKSSLAAAIGQATGGGAYFATPQTTVQKIRQFCDWWIEQAKTIQLLIVDDLASYRATPHVHDTILAILACRYDNFRRTVITSNASLADIAKWLDPRLADRLREGLVMFSGRESKRETGNRKPEPKKKKDGVIQ